ncbi:FAD/FMN-containing dehydrogenase [Pseudonocardia hierapolitana]|uniref:FAD/FMN-containing dehydrogenase n=1 Tax=Pseudonocardia hierapolitana TaxID=1128676 RepID=A0A561SLE2_9PSEU|nr:FAD-binding oxidoreductase [Pseudonocardia hierapolitana]TWF75679.1 FAD/FMN-containing dehydrogenase [Pseudonocardia hierapolitana]
MSIETHRTAQALDLGRVAHELEIRLTGALHLPGDAGYERQREGFRGAPAVVVDAETVADVRATVLAARRSGLPLTVLSTGHGTVAAPDGGFLLRTSRVAQVLVDPDRRVARLGPGVRWSDVIAAAEPFGLAPLSGDTPSVGVVGYTLGGGLSWLSRKYGFAADSLLKAELVTADGRVVVADRRHHTDLFWAIRGGSGNFGVVTSLELRLYPVPSVYGGWAEFPVDGAERALRHLAEHGDELPDELSVSLMIGKESLVIRAVHAGRDGRAALQPLLDAAGTPVVDRFREMRYSEVSTIGGTPPITFAMYDELSEETIAAIVDQVVNGDVPAVEVKHWGGAIARPAHDDPGPVSHRDARFVMKIAAPAADAITASATGGSFLNFLHDTTRTHTAFTPENHRRLREVKTAYDPGNLFHRNHNIPPLG